MPVPLGGLGRTPVGVVGWYRLWQRYARRTRRHTRRLGEPLGRIAAVEGFLSDEESRLLHDLAAGARGGAIVEIGTYRGKSTIALALGALAGAGAPVYAIDPLVDYTGPLGGRQGPQDKTQLFANLLLAGVAEHVWLLQTTSAQAAQGWTEPIALLWIDGDHRYEGVRADIDAWASFVIPGGVMAFDDSLREDWGIHRAVAEVLAAGGWEREAVVGKVTALRRRTGGALGARGESS